MNNFNASKTYRFQAKHSSGKFSCSHRAFMKTRMHFRYELDVFAMQIRHRSKNFIQKAYSIAPEPLSCDGYKALKKL